MAASYPTTAKAFTTKATGDTYQAAHINDLQDEVTAIETALLTSGLAHAVKITAGAGGASLTLPTTGRLYFDGGTNTYLVERASDTLNAVVGGTSMVDISATQMSVYGDIVMTALKKIYLDGGGNTYLQESAGDQLDLVSGGTCAVRCIGANTTLYGTLTVPDGLISVGANDSGGTGYRLLRVPNA